MAAALAAACLVAACGGAGDGGPDAGPAPSTSDAPPASVGDPAVPAEGVDTPPAPGEGAPTASAPSAGAPAAPPPSTATPASTAPVAGGVGSLAGAYLRPDGPAAVLVEVRSQDGAAPRPDAVQRVAAVLGRVSGKAVEVVSGPAGVDGARAWTANDLRALADGGAPQTAERAVLRLLFLRGGFAEDDRAVGVAVRGDVAAVFADRVDEATGVFGDRGAVEDAVTMHEVGHLLGLVDLVLDTGRADPEHPGHSPNRGSVMYYAVESTLLGSVLAGGPPRDFDADDLADLARIRDR